MVLNNKEPNMIGEYISALSNSATLLGREKGYLVWGIDNKTRNIIGTDLVIDLSCSKLQKDKTSKI